jgi:hypothetical protein
MLYDTKRISLTRNLSTNRDLKFEDSVVCEKDLEFLPLK